MWNTLFLHIRWFSFLMKRGQFKMWNKYASLWMAFPGNAICCTTSLYTIGVSVNQPTDLTNEFTCWRLQKEKERKNGWVNETEGERERVNCTKVIETVHDNASCMCYVFTIIRYIFLYGAEISCLLVAVCGAVSNKCRCMHRFAAFMCTVFVFQC